MTYLDAGYDMFMHRSLTADEQFNDQLSQVNPDLLTPPSSLDSSNIQSIALDKITGGALTLGGQNNGLGTVTIKDNTGKSIYVIDNLGLNPVV